MTWHWGQFYSQLQTLYSNIVPHNEEQWDDLRVGPKSDRAPRDITLLTFLHDRLFFKYRVSRLPSSVNCPAPKWSQSRIRKDLMPPPPMLLNVSPNKFVRFFLLDILHADWRRTLWFLYSSFSTSKLFGHFFVEFLQFSTENFLPLRCWIWWAFFERWRNSFFHHGSFFRHIFLCCAVGWSLVCYYYAVSDDWTSNLDLIFGPEFDLGLGTLHPTKLGWRLLPFSPHTSGHDYLDAEWASCPMNTHWNTVHCASSISTSNSAFPGLGFESQSRQFVCDVTPMTTHINQSIDQVITKNILHWLIVAES